MRPGVWGLRRAGDLPAGGTCLWMKTGVSGTLDTLADVTCRVRDQAFVLELREAKDAAPVVGVGMNDAAELEAVAARLVRSAAEYRKRQAVAPDALPN